MVALAANWVLTLSSRCSQQRALPTMVQNAQNGSIESDPGAESAY